MEMTTLKNKQTEILPLRYDFDRRSWVHMPNVAVGQVFSKMYNTPVDNNIRSVWPIWEHGQAAFLVVSNGVCGVWQFKRVSDSVWHDLKSLLMAWRIADNGIHDVNYQEVKHHLPIVAAWWSARAASFSDPLFWGVSHPLWNAKFRASNTQLPRIQYISRHLQILMDGGILLEMNQQTANNEV